mmetsp:Transcript_12287/g.13649  ORF Transcript_12287/g.13649 Transcript_12287/m.13649 type:complete len:536 (-) Transcript_12287:111-1718(-)
MKSLDIFLILSLCIKDVFAFLPMRTLSTHLDSIVLKGEETDDIEDPFLIRGVRKNERILDAGEGGVAFAEETAIRCSGMVMKNDNDEDNKVDAEIVFLDHFKKVRFIDDPTKNLNIIATGIGLSNYDKISSGSYSWTDFATAQEIEYAPLEAAKAVVRSLGEEKDKSYDRLVINILGGEDLAVSNSINATEIIANELSNVKEIVFNSLSFGDFAENYTTIVCVATEKLSYTEYDTIEEEDLANMKIDIKKEKKELNYQIEAIAENWNYEQLSTNGRNQLKQSGFKKKKSTEATKISGLTAGELYLYKGKYVTVSDLDAVQFTDSENPPSLYSAFLETDEFKEYRENQGKGVDFEKEFELYDALKYLQEEKKKLTISADQDDLFMILAEISNADTPPEVVAQRREYLLQNYEKQELESWGYSENSIDIDLALTKAVDEGVLEEGEEEGGDEDEEDMQKFMASLETVLGVEVKDEDDLIKLTDQLQNMPIEKAVKDRSSLDESSFEKLSQDEIAALEQFPALVEQFKKVAALMTEKQ